MHDIPHDKERSQPHEHDHRAPNSPGKIKMILSFTLEHNRQHVLEAGALAEKLQEMGREEAAARVREAAREYESGNGKLDEALSLLD